MNFDITSIHAAIIILKANVSCGADDIPSILHKMSGPNIHTLLLRILTLSLEAGTYPETSKVTHIVPKHKSGIRNLIINRLQSLEITNPLLWWIKSFLANRYQITKINSITSTLRPITRSVVQGSVSSSLGFTIYINNVRKCFNTGKIHLYADGLHVIYITNTCDVHITKQTTERKNRTNSRPPLICNPALSSMGENFGPWYLHKLCKMPPGIIFHFKQTSFSNIYYVEENIVTVF